ECRASTDPVVGRFFGDGHIVNVTLAHAGTGDADELRASTHLFDAAAAGVAHGGAQAARQLVQYGDQAALVWDASFDAFRHQLLEFRRGVLEIPVARTM